MKQIVVLVATVVIVNRRVVADVIAFQASLSYPFQFMQHVRRQFVDSVSVDLSVRIVFYFCIELPFFICNGILMVNFSTFNQQSDAIDQNQPNANGQEQQTKFIHHAHVTNYILKFSHFSLLLRSLDRSNKYFVCAVINNTVVSCASSNAPCSMCVFIFIVFTH